MRKEVHSPLLQQVRWRPATRARRLCSDSLERKVYAGCRRDRSLCVARHRQRRGRSLVLGRGPRVSKLVQLISRIAPGLPSRVRWYVMATCVAGVPVVAVGGSRGDRAPIQEPRSLFGIAMFFAFTTLAEWRPMPIDSGGPPARLAGVRLHHRLPDALRLGVVGADRRRRDRPGDGVGARRAAEGRLQQRGLRARGGSCRPAGARLRARQQLQLRDPRDRGRLLGRAVRPGQRDARLHRHRAVHPELAARRVPRPSPPVGADLLDHDLRRDAGRHLLAAVGPARDAAERAALRAHALPALVRPAPGRGGGGGDRQPDRPQESPRVRAGVARGARDGAARRHRVRALPDRHRPLQAGQRPPRPSRRRRGAQVARRGDRAGRARPRLPARRRRVRAAAREAGRRRRRDGRRAGAALHRDASRAWCPSR